MLGERAPKACPLWPPPLVLLTLLNFPEVTIIALIGGMAKQR